MKIDPKLVEQFRVASWDAHPMPDDYDQRLQFIIQRAADHALEEAAKLCDRRGGRFKAESPFAHECYELSDEIRAMKGTK